MSDSLSSPIVPSIPRCSHGEIILGCSHDDCPDQEAYLAKSRLALAKYDAYQTAQARALVRNMLGLPPWPVTEEIDDDTR